MRAETLEEMEEKLRRHTQRWDSIYNFFHWVWAVLVLGVIAVVELLPYFHMACHKD